jgi:glucose-1-phosphate thymidylyltransferase
MPMKAIITAGGRGTRLRPITWTLNKHLIPLANEPMLFNALKKVAAVGIKDVAINVNPGDTEIARVCGDGSKWGLNLVYLEQEGGAVGVGQIVWNAREFIGNDDVLLYFGDNIVLGSLHKMVDKFYREQLDCCLAFSKVPDPNRFGVPEFNEAGELVGVVEKPENPQSDFAVTGIYIYKAQPHYEAFKNIKPSARGEYEISDIHDWLLKYRFKVGFEEITGWWKDTGKPGDLLEGNQLILNELTRDEMKVSHSAQIAKTANLQGLVKVGDNTIIGENVLIRGPVVIGDNVKIEDSFVGPHTTIGHGSVLLGAEIEHSIIMDGAKISATKRIIDSIIGQNVTITDENDSWPKGHKMIIGENSQIEL